MTSLFDLVIRGGQVVDGTGRAAFAADVGVRDGLIAEVGQIPPGAGGEEIDASGKIVTPGFVDVHTHYDAQATWDERMHPSSWHGVTTVITGNCGVGFAPCKPDQRHMLIRLMEGVEDIPEVVMEAGLPWTWETFPEFLDTIDGRPFDVDVGVQAPHSAFRVYVMGERGAAREAATPEEIEKMSELATEALQAGAFGITTSRFLGHRTRAGELAPSIDSAEAELQGLARGVRRAGGGVMQLITGYDKPAAGEYAVMRRMVETSGQPLSFTLIASQDNGWQEYVRLLAEDQPKAAPMRGQAYPRPTGTLFGLDLSFHPFSLNPSYAPLANLPLAEKVERLKDPELRARLLAEEPQDTNENVLKQIRSDRNMYVLGDPPDYTPPPEAEIGEIAKRRGVSRKDALYDALLENEGRAVLYRPGSNYLDGTTDAILEIMRAPHMIFGLGDGGAHYGMICDASYPTYVLIRWVRDAAPHEKVSLEWAIEMLAAKTAEAMGLTDRGVIAVGRKADLNVIDLDRLTLRAPHVVRDLPENGRRLRQRAEGFTATIKNGQVTYRDGEPTGALPGRLIRRGGESQALAAE